MIINPLKNCFFLIALARPKAILNGEQWSFGLQYSLACLFRLSRVCWLLVYINKVTGTWGKGYDPWLTSEFGTDRIRVFLGSVNGCVEWYTTGSWLVHKYFCHSLTYWLLTGMEVMSQVCFQAYLTNLASCALPAKLGLDECRRTSLMRSQHWFRQWLGPRPMAPNGVTRPQWGTCTAMQNLGIEKKIYIVHFTH